MSLINKMLKDLDKRGGDNAGTEAARASIKAVSLGGRKKGRPLLWISLLIVISVAVAAAWFFRDRFLKPTQPVVKPGPVPPVSSAPPLVTATPPVATVVAKPVEPGKGDDIPVTSPPRVATVVATPAAKVPPAPAPVAAASASVPAKAPAAMGSAPQVKKPTPAPTAPVARVASAAQPKPAVATNVAQQKKVVPEKQGAAGTNEAKPGLAMATAPATSRKPVKRGSVPTQTRQAAIEVTPQQRADSDYGKAVALIEEGRNTEAIAMLEGVLVKQYKHAAARQTLAGLLIEANRSNDAVKVLQEGLRADSSQTGMAMILARLQVEKGESKAALATLQQSLPYAKNKPDYQAFMAALYQRDNRHKEAIEHYRTAVGESPGNGVWWMGYGISLKAAGRTADARTAFVQARDSGKLTPALKTFVEQQLAVLPQ